MKILLVITKADIGGAQVFVLNLAETLIRYGFDVTVVAGSGDYLPTELNKRKIEFFYFDSLRRGYSVLSSLLFIKDLHRLIKKSDYDIVHLNSTNTLVGVISSLFTKKHPKFIFTIHGLSFLDRNYEMNFIFKYFTKLYFKIFLRLTDENVFVSELNFEESVGEKFVKTGKVIINGLPEKKMEYYAKSEARSFFSKRFGVDISESFIIGSVGRLAYQKNYEFLLYNFSSLKEKFPKLKILIVGDGPYLERFLKNMKIFGHENDFLFSGAIENSYKYIKAFDLYTLPSRYEGLSISLIEAIFAELPILASDVGGNTEVVKGDTRQLFELNNIDDYIKKLQAIISERGNIIEHNKKLKDEFSLEKMVVKYKDLYEKLVNEQD